MSKIIADTYKAGGISAFYSGSSAVAFRQGTNWASRQGFSDGISKAIKIYFHGNPDAKLTSAQFVAAGIIAGVLSVWNQPFEVARIEMQASANDGAKSRSMFQVRIGRIVQRNHSEDIYICMANIVDGCVCWFLR